MKVSYTTANGRLTFEIEVTTGKQAFEVVAAVQELFEEPACGLCKSALIRCDVREFDNNKYFKLVCNACGGQIDLGQHKDGKGLFVKRLDKDTKKPLPNRGWYIWDGRNQ